MQPDPDALFTVVDDLVYPSDLTRGGWSDHAQHGGPPAALLAWALERLPTQRPMELVRLTVDLFREVPLTPLTVRTDVLRDGRRIQLATASLDADGVEVAKARGLKIRLAEIDLPPSPNPPWEAPPDPESAEPLDWRALPVHWGPLRRFHLDAIEIRSVGGSFLRLGPGLSWFRLRYPVISGEPTSPVVRVAALADMGNGNSQSIDAREWLYVNPDLTLHLHRDARGEWLGMRSVAYQHDTGIGFADTELFDLDGPVGRVAQSQVIERHDAST